MQSSETKQILVLMTLAYIFSIAVRLIWVYQFNGYDNFMWNNQLMINTNDGYYFAESARDMLNGTTSFKPDHNGALAIVTVFIAKLLPFSFETIILYMPAFLGSLLVVPISLIGYSIKRPYMGFVAALLGAVVWSYYNRTMAGYYDSDMLNIVGPMFVLWSIIHALITQKNRYLVLMIFFMVLSQWWYPKNVALNTAMVFVGVLYVMIKDRHNIFNLKLIVFALIGLAIMPFYLKVILSFALFGMFHYRDKLSQKYIYPILGVLLIIYIYSGALNDIWSSLNLYLVNRFFPSETLGEVAQLHFYGVIGTVREAGAISFETFANRISGHSVTFFVSTIGVIMMIVRYPILVISLPMVAMGFMAYKSGLRFTVYAVPVYALGFGYLVVFLANKLEFLISDKKKLKISKISLIAFIVLMALYPNITHVIGYKVPTVLNKAEVEDLARLEKMSSPEDYTLSWWDYGYPIRYYSMTKTLIDGGKHQNDNFIISKILQTSSQELTANLSRLAVETYVYPNCNVVANTIFKNKQKDQINPNLFLSELEDPEYKLPKKTRDIYLYLPYRMMRIFPTVAVFGNLDLSTGEAERKILFYPTNARSNKNGVIVLNNGITVDTKKGEITLGQQKKTIKYFIITQNTKQGKVHLQSQLYHTDGKYAVIYMKSYGQFVVMDTETFNSAYVQMFILGKYDKNLFELVVSSPYSKIYRLKK